MTRLGGSLTARVLAVLIVATVTPTLVVGYLAIRHARSDLEREVVRGNLALIRTIGASVDDTLQSARRSLDLAAASWADQRLAPPARGSFEAGGPGGEPTARSVDDDATRRATGRLLRRLRREVPLFATLSIVDIDGVVLHGDPISDAGTGAHTFGGYIGDVVFEDGRPRVRVVSQARSRTGELVGVFVAQLDLHFISELLGQTRLGEGARLLVVDGDGLPVARSDGVPVAGGSSLRGSNPAVDLALGSATEGNLETGEVVAVYRNLSSYQSLRGVRWAIILEQPTRYAYALARKTTRDTLIVGVSVLAIAVFLGVLLATRLTRPLRVLAERADAIAAAGGIPEDAPAAPLDAPGEIGALAHRLDEMARRIGERTELQGALARGDRLVTVGTMSASVAHEINNPLTTVLGYAKLLAEDKAEDHPDRAGLELIADEAARMKQIVGALLDYSRAERSPMSAPGDVNEILERTAALLAPALRRSRVKVALDLAAHLPRANDGHALQQVFVNLAQNAAQAMTEGGTLTITSKLLVDALAVEVCFIDQGPGVAAADRDRIFTPFYTTKAPGDGTGLGLAVCKHLIDRCDGTIEVTDAPDGHGACFRVVIPIEE